MLYNDREALMIKFLFIFFSFFAISKPDDRCLKQFNDVKPENPIELSRLENPYSLKLNSTLHTAISNTKFLSPKEKKAFFKELKQTISYIESKDLGHTHREKRNARLKALESMILQAVKTSPIILSFLEQTSLPYINKKQVAEIIFITLTKYVRVHLSHPKEEANIDFKRFEKIISSIAHFNWNAFSIYKIIRAVREKYSLHEYLNCK